MRRSSICWGGGFLPFPSYFQVEELPGPLFTLTHLLRKWKRRAQGGRGSDII